MYAITGVSGHTGSATATALLAQGKLVRVVVRDAAKGAPWRAKGAEVAVADMDGDDGALVRAFTGTQGVYLMHPPDVVSPDPLRQYAQRNARFARVLPAAKVPHVVLLSSVGAHLPDGTGPIRGLHASENTLRATGIPVTAIRASYFQENWAASLGALPESFLPAFMPPTQRFAQVSTIDIGRTAAGALVEGPRGFHPIELAGPRDYSAEDVAAELSSLVGRTITVAPAPLEAVVPTFTSFGMSTELAELYREMYAGLASGHIVAETKPTRGSVELRETLRGLLAQS